VTAFYLVTGVGQGVESDLGMTSTEIIRPNTHPCEGTPDLIPTEVSGPPTATSGSWIVVHDTVLNQGTAPAGVCRLGLYLSPDPTITFADIHLGDRFIWPLAPGVTNSTSTALMLGPGLGSGTWYLGAIADVYGEVSESDETNNSLTGSPIVIVDLGLSVLVSDRPAFDKCEIPTVGQMQTWWDGSPYYEMNLYIGGSNRACSNLGLDAGWVAAVGAQGWNFVPTWVGPQAPCTGYGSRLSLDPVVAHEEGRAEADAALAVAESLGLFSAEPPGTIVYFDMEAYDTTNSACRTAVESFISGWVGRIHERGSRAGAYGSSCGSGVAGWAGIPNVPHDIWAAHWIATDYDPSVTVWGLACVPDSFWVGHQRIRQYTGGHHENWNGLTLNIDSDICDGHVVGRNAREVGLLPAALQAESGFGGTPVRRIQLRSAGHGLVVSERTVKRTSDEGREWSDLGTAGEAPLDAYFLDAERGWTVSRSTITPASTIRVRRTVDGGATWSSREIRVNQAIDRAYLDFLDSRHGWLALELASGSNFSLGRLYATADSGSSWIERSLPIGSSVRLVEPGVGWTAGGHDGRQLFMTRDDGRTWQPIEVGVPQRAYLHLPTFTTPAIGVLPVTVADPQIPHVAFHITDDGGRLWQSAATLSLGFSVPPGTRVPVSIVDRNTWIVVNPESGRLHRTEDGGKSFKVLETPLAGAVDLHFTDPDVGWVYVKPGACRGEKSGRAFPAYRCQSTGKLFATADGGVSWVPLNL